MAIFQEAISKTLLFEGGYSNDPSDNGGETYRGISRHSFCHWIGWTLIDGHKSDPDFPKCLDLDQQLQGLVVMFYLNTFWHYDDIQDQDIADKIFDLAVNIGQVHAIKILQLALNQVSNAALTVEGNFGKRTLAAVNASPKGSLLPVVRFKAAEYHTQIAQSHPQDEKFLKGWLARDAA